ncbi:MAG: DUF721 domain-containing protein [Proteobacteria bacterium]|jgi:hypothetical protein|nr:DUF721 domain-containing protein [Pseudomonadota bacterium]
MWKKLNFQSVTPAIRGQGQTPQEEWIRFVEGFDFFALIEKWPEIVGEMMADQSLPLRLKNKTLFILTRHPAFAEKLKFLEKPLIAKIATLFPLAAPMIQKISFESNESFFIEKKATLPKKAEPVIHKFSPEYRRLRAEAEALFKDIEAGEEKERWISLYVQAASTPNT